jgi:hypothetical protein
MSKVEKIKRVIMIAAGFGLSTYLIMSGMAMLDQEEKMQEEKKAEKSMEKKVDDH